MTLYQRMKRWIRSSIEDPSVPLSSIGYSWQAKALNKYECRLPRQEALHFAPVNRAVSLISNYISDTPLDLFKKEGEGKTRDDAHPIQKRLKRNVNDYDSFQIWLNSCLVDVLLDGNSFSHIVRDGGLRPLYWYRLDPSQVTPEEDDDGTRSYRVRLKTGNDVTLPASDCLHLRGLGTPLMGYSNLELMSKTVHLGEAQQRYSFLFFLKGGMGKTSYCAPESIGDDARERMAVGLKESHADLEAAFDPLFLEEGVEPKNSGFSPEQSQMIEAKKFSVKSVANHYGCGSWKLGDDQRTSYNSLEMDENAFQSQCANHYFRMVEVEMDNKLLTLSELDTHNFEFNRESLIRTNYGEKVSGINTLVGKPVMTVNEGRALLNLNPVENGDELNEPEPVQPAPFGGEPVSEPEQPPSDPESDQPGD